MNYALTFRETRENPIGLNGFSFIEFSTPNPAALSLVLKRFGFRYKAEDINQDISFYGQGNINIIINNKPESYAAKFNKKPGAFLSAMGWRVKDAEFAFRETVRRGAIPFEDKKAGLGIPAIYGIGGSLIYFVDDEGEDKLYRQMLVANSDDVETTKANLQFIDHVDHNVSAGRRKYWVAFYENLFNFKAINYFDVEAKVTGFSTEAVASPCGKMAVAIVESFKGKTVVDEFLEKTQREGVQHVAFHAVELCDAVEYMRSQGQEFLTIPEQYYKTIDDRVPGHRENLERLKKNRILIDGNKAGYLLQIFTVKEPLLDPFFFEFITRKEFQGFGEGNVKSLLETIEIDQFKRGFLKEEMPV